MTIPFFSVIIPNYNHAAFLEKRITTVLNQTYRNFEVIILDDASTDKSREIIERYRHVPCISHVIYNAVNSGSPFIQWKKGIELAKGRWVWIAESDDYANCQFLAKAFAAIQAHPSIGLFYCDAYIINKSGAAATERFSRMKNIFFKTKKWDHSYFKNGPDEINESLKYICSINNASSVVFDKKAAEPFLPNLVDFCYHGDWYLFLRINFVSDVFYCSEPLSFFRAHPESHLANSRFSVQKKKEHFRILKLIYDDNRISEKARLLKHFSGYFLSFGFIETAPKTIWRIVKSYYLLDVKLTLKVILEIIRIKITRKRYKGWFMYNLKK